MATRKTRRASKAQRQQQAAFTGVLCVLAIIASVAVAIALVRDGVAAAAGKNPNSVPQPTPQATPGDTEPTAAPLTEAELRIQAAVEKLGDRCTGTAPQVTDPATWNDAGKALIDRLMADPYYVEHDLNVKVKNGCPYMLAVNRAGSTVTVLTADSEGRYTVPYMAFVCSGGESTPLGYYVTKVNYDWRLLSGPCYGQFATRFWDSFLFHSVPYYTEHQDDLEYDQYNQLGTAASLGCIRLSVVDAKWIYDNCPIGTRVVTYDDAANPGPMGKPGTIYTDPADTSLRGWDPTDPDPRNPWDDKYLPGTAIRSDAAWEEYNAAMADGRWSKSINQDELQGYSTDSNVAGTRG